LIDLSRVWKRTFENILFFLKQRTTPLREVAQSRRQTQR